MARVITMVDTDGFWYDSNPHPLGNIIVLENELIVSPTVTPKLSERLKMAFRVLRKPPHPLSERSE